MAWTCIERYIRTVRHEWLAQYIIESIEEAQDKFYECTSLKKGDFPVGVVKAAVGDGVGIGCECLDLARGVWREIAGPEPFRIPAYSRDLGETGPREGLAIARAGPCGRRQAGPLWGFSDRL